MKCEMQNAKREVDEVRNAKREARIEKSVIFVTLCLQNDVFTSVFEA